MDRTHLDRYHSQQPHNTQTYTDRTNLDNSYQLHSTQESRGERVESNRYEINSDVSFRTELRMAVKYVNFPPLPKHKPAGTSQELAKPERADEVVPKTSVHGNTVCINTKQFSP